MTLGETIRIGESPSRRVWFIALVVLCAVYALGVSNQWAISPDGALYLTLGRSLAEGRGMEFNGVQWWGIPPVLPVLIAACRLVAGDGYWLINLVLSACGVGTAVVAARTVKRLGAADLALPVLLTTGFSAYLFITATRIQTDVLFTFLVALGLYGFVRGSAGSPWWIVFGGAAMLLATLTRLPGIVFFAGAVPGLALSLRRPGRAWRIAALAAVVIAAAAVLWYWMMYVRSQAAPDTGDYGEATNAYFNTLLDPRRLNKILRGLAALPSAAFASLLAQQLNSWLMLGPLLVALLGLATLARRGQWIIVLTVVSNVGFLVLFGYSAVARRYLLPTMPFLVYALLVGTQTAVAWVRRRQARDGAAAGRMAVGIVATVCIVISIPKIAREVYWMRSPDFYAAYEHGEWQNFVLASRYLREHGRAGIDEVMGPEHTVVHYLSRLGIFTQVLEPGLGTWKPAAIPPERFVKAAVDSPARFILIPTNAAPWSEEAASRFAATGLFDPPVLFGITPATPSGTLALYTRRGPADGGTGKGQLP